jgi:hypothetical protein
MGSIIRDTLTPITRPEPQAEASRAIGEDRPTASRVRELLGVMVALLVIAGVGAFMVACTRG